MPKFIFIFLVFCLAPYLAQAALPCSVCPGDGATVIVEDAGKQYVIKDGSLYSEGENVRLDLPESAKLRRFLMFYSDIASRPFFFSSIVDPAKLRESADYLEREETAAIALYGETGKVYPTGFLRGYARASELYGVLVSTPSYDNAVELMAQIKKTVAEYSASAAAIGNELVSRIKASGSGSIFYLGGETSVDGGIIASDFAVIMKNARAAEAELARLENCLYKSEKYCRSGMSLASERSSGNGTVSAEAGQERPKLFSASELGLKEYRGPYEVKSSCWGGKDVNYLYYAENCSIGSCMEWSHLATDRYFIPPSKEAVYESKLKNAGFPVIPQSATSNYACNNLEYKAELQTLDCFLRKYDHSPVFGFKNSPYSKTESKIIEDIGREEKRFLDLKIKSWDGLDSLGTSYMRAYKDMDAARTEDRRNLYERWQFISQKTPELHKIINRITIHLKNFRLKAGLLPKSKIALLYVYVIRSGYSITFMPFSPTVWLIPEKPAYMKKESRERMHRRIPMNYEEAVTTYGRDRLDAVIRYMEKHPKKEPMLGEL